MIISFSPSVIGVNTLLSKKFAWKIRDLSTENLLDPVLNYTEKDFLHACICSVVEHVCSTVQYHLNMVYMTHSVCTFLEAIIT